MRILGRRPVLVGFCVCLALGLVLSVGPASSPALAARADDPEAERAQREEARRKDREERIQEYLRKKEEREARRQLERELKEAEREAPPPAAPAAQPAQATAQPAAQPTVQPAAQPAAPKRQAAPAAEPAAAVPTPKNRKERRPRKASSPPGGGDDWVVDLPRSIRRINENLRRTRLGQDPTVESYVSLVERGEASAYHLAAFGNFLGQNGMLRDAIEYYALALDLQDQDPVLWMNVGTLHRQLGEYSIAADVYREALTLDPNNAFAHYNLGAVLDEMNEYEGAIEEYKLALTLDPSLGDPATNPAAANNERLLAVKLMLYEEQTGSLGLPLVDVQVAPVEGSDRR